MDRVCKSRHQLTFKSPHAPFTCAALGGVPLPFFIPPHVPRDLANLIISFHLTPSALCPPHAQCVASAQRICCLDGVTVPPDFSLLEYVEQHDRSAESSRRPGPDGQPLSRVLLLTCESGERLLGVYFPTKWSTLLVEFPWAETSFKFLRNDDIADIFVNIISCHSSCVRRVV